MDGFEKDGRWWFNCGCNFEIIGPPWGKSKTPKLRFSSDLHNPNHTINFSCPATWELLGTGRTKGIFQLETEYLGGRWCKELKPENKEHIAVLGALLRPGCLRSIDYSLHCKDCNTTLPIREKDHKTPSTDGDEDDSDFCLTCGSHNVKRIGTSMTKHYCLRKNGLERVESYHPVIDAILAPTYNVLAYQEQSMQIAVACANFNLQEADMLRKAIGKKLPEEMAKSKKLFMEKAAEAKVISMDQAEEVFGWIEKSQRYSFNKCVSGNTIIRKAAKNHYMLGYGYTVAHMYNIKNSIIYAKNNGQISLYKKWKLAGNYGKGLSMCDDGRIRPNIIKDITYEGIKDIYRVTLETSEYIDVTINHKFPTENGDKKLEDLSVGDSLIVKGDYEQSNFKDLNSFSKIKVEELRTIAKNRVHDGETIGFVSGQQNPGYTNGSYTEFNNNKNKLPRCCDKCGTTESRLECHHINGDRANSSIENLVILCSSCHKKIEYLNGRIKRGEKGYPSVLRKIKSIEYIGTDDVYNVEMDGPNHNFVVNDGIVTSNSHAASYGETGYVCAYNKTHFPLAFYRKWLEWAHEKQEPAMEIQELVNDARVVSNIKIRTPDIRFLKDRVYSDGENIYFGLQDIKGIGDSQIKKLRSVLENLEISRDKLSKMTWLEFLTKISDNISSIAINGFIRSGALSYMKIDRIRMAKEYEIWNNLTIKEKEFAKLGIDKLQNIEDVISYIITNKGYHNAKRLKILQEMLDSLVNSPYNLEDTVDYLVYSEEELLGIALTCHITDTVLGVSETHTCKDIVKNFKGYAVLKVCLNEVKSWKCKNGQEAGNKMAFIKASDKTCQLNDIIIFPKQYKEYSHILSQGNIVYISGKIGNKGSFIIERVYEHREV